MRIRTATQADLPAMAQSPGRDQTSRLPRLLPTRAADANVGRKDGRGLAEESV